MPTDTGPGHLVELNTTQPIWECFYWVAPLVLIGTREADGGHDLAPKHMVTPLGWQNYFGFVCEPRHRTYQNARREGAFTVSYPRPSQLVETSLAASPRDSDGNKPALDALPVFAALGVDAPLLRGGYLFLECALERVIDGFGNNSLVVGRITAARIDPSVQRHADGDPQALLKNAPLLVYLHPERFASIDQSFSFPFPAGMRK
ncbi:MAG: flavin reductase [Xanthomonadales bacterium]|nr:flavin reductase [Xanthomonadales bacterium]NIN60604.1 flavin reductase [Xanthomonadales bacterium]NIN75956.1 flavin reductase [Xanthomonadales bacterium]NIO15048.1 flavin reductase [Xanthomonadales bacterium]NIP12997.1 flavin reductase [Xanthomonadales bacterium]